MEIPKLSILVLLLALMIIFPATMFSQPKLDNEVIQAVNNSDLSSLAVWVANGGDVNAMANNDNTLLMIASKVGDQQMLDYLFALNADVNARNRVGSTALMMAAKYGHGHIIDMLLEQGADPTVRNDYGITAARFALASDHDEVYYKLQQAAMMVRSNS